MNDLKGIKRITCKDTVVNNSLKPKLPKNMTLLTEEEEEVLELDLIGIMKDIIIVLEEMIKKLRQVPFKNTQQYIFTELVCEMFLSKLEEIDSKFINS